MGKIDGYWEKEGSNSNRRMLPQIVNGTFISFAAPISSYSHISVSPSKVFQKVLPFFMIFGMCLSFSNAQLGNGELYRSLWQQELDSMDQPIQAIKGKVFEDFFPAFEPDSQAILSLSLLTPSIFYQKVSKGKYIRSFRQNYQIEGKGFRSGIIVFEDTLTSKQLKTLIKTKGLPNELNGDNPFFFSKYVGPFLGIMGSTGVIFALFYIRSR